MAPPMINTNIIRNPLSSSHLRLEARNSREAQRSPTSLRPAVGTLYEEVEEEEEAEEIDVNEGDDEEEEYDDDDPDQYLDDSTVSSSPSIADGNINFDVVYALHTFVATVEGQASVEKGCALTLLDDSNSYWWLVKVEDTSEIGYIPAENIELPYERLARYNKHRNIDNTDASNCYFAQTEKGKGGKRVAISDDLYCQSQYILVDNIDVENEEEVEDYEEAYEEWEEKMTVYDEDDWEDEAEMYTGDDNSDQPGGTRPRSSANTPVDACRPASRSTKLSLSIDFPSIIDDKNGMKVMLRRLLSRSKKPGSADEKGKRDGSDRDSTTSITLSNTSSLEDGTVIPHEPDKNDKQLTVIRVFRGNINVAATFNTVLVDEHTSVDQLLEKALSRFRLSNDTSSHVEYYLTVKVMGKEEITLAPEEKPLAIFQSLTSHLTTPMPSLTHNAILSHTPSAKITRIGVVSKSKIKKAPEIGNNNTFGEDSVVRFFLHKRIKRVNESSGQMRVKVSYYSYSDQDDEPGGSGNNFFALSTFSARSLLRHRSQPPPPKESQRIDKLIEVPASITMDDLARKAAEKFNLIQRPVSDTSLPPCDGYLSLHGKDERLETTQTLLELSKQQPKGTIEILWFVFRLEKSRRPSHSSGQSSSTRSRAPELSPSLTISPTTVSTVITPCVAVSEPLGDATDAGQSEHILQRIDAALLTLEKPTIPRNPTSNAYHIPIPCLKDDTITAEKSPGLFDDMQSELQRIMEEHTAG